MIALYVVAAWFIASVAVCAFLAGLFALGKRCEITCPTRKVIIPRQVAGPTHPERLVRY